MRPTARRAAFATAAAGAVRADGPTGVVGRVSSIPAMVRDTLLGRWYGLGRGRLTLLVLGVAYLVSPIDLMPELLLTIPGLADDALVAAWVVATTLGAAGDYRDWRAGTAGLGGYGYAAPGANGQPGAYGYASAGAPAGAAGGSPRVVPGTVL